MPGTRTPCELPTGGIRTALQISATNPEHPALLLDLPWEVPLDSWPEKHLVPLPRGISRHVVRCARAGGETVAVKELAERPALRE